MPGSEGREIGGQAPNEGSGSSQEARWRTELSRQHQEGREWGWENDGSGLRHEERWRTFKSPTSERKGVGERK